MRESIDRADGVSREYLASAILLPSLGSTRLGPGRSSEAIAFQAGVCIPASASNSEDTAENPQERGIGHCNSTLLAQEALIHPGIRNEHRTANSSSIESQSAVAGKEMPSTPQQIETCSMEIERGTLK